MELHAKRSNDCVSSSKNDPLDFSSIKDCIEGDDHCPRLQSDILDVLVSLLQCADERDNKSSICDAVKKITNLYLKAKPADSNGGSFQDPEDYEVEAFLWLF